MLNSINAAGEQFLGSIDALQTRIDQAQLQISSGYRINSLADAPAQLPDLFQTRTDLAQATQTDQNLTRVQGEVNSADSSVQTAIQLLDSAASLASQGASSTVSASQRAGLAQQVQQLLEQVVGISQTKVNGIYIFSGDQTSSPPYQLDSTTATGVKQLTTAAATRLIQDPTGLTFAVAKTAQELFDAPGASVFAALNSLATALSSNNQTGITNAQAALGLAQDQLNQQGTFYGSVQNRISSAIDLSQKFELQLKSQLSSQQDADITAQAIELTQSQTGLTAAMSAQGKRITSTLFDYLK